ncbi:unnamed protein product [Miscanthus lutarioriparius]|uniref:Uncharacterized protein n=1 Tax=Miscanthus lutarioriparius TaxID=422564 RepID=A0A811S2P0_9POAL|nr:unnamed protein product [Miscanthus lutarioriparius]
MAPAALHLLLAILCLGSRHARVAAAGQPPFVKNPSNNQPMQDESKLFLHAIFSNRPPKYYNNVFFSQIAHKSIHLAQSMKSNVGQAKGSSKIMRNSIEKLILRVSMYKCNAFGIISSSRKRTGQQWCSTLPSQKYVKKLIQSRQAEAVPRGAADLPENQVG